MTIIAAYMLVCSVGILWLSIELVLAVDLDKKSDPDQWNDLFEGHATKPTGSVTRIRIAE